MRRAYFLITYKSNSRGRYNCAYAQRLYYDNCGTHVIVKSREMCILISEITLKNYWLKKGEVQQLVHESHMLWISCWISRENLQEDLISGSRALSSSKLSRASKTFLNSWTMLSVAAVYFMSRTIHWESVLCTGGDMLRSVS